MYLITHKKYLALAILGALIIAAMVIYVTAPSVQSADGELDRFVGPTVDAATDTAASSTNFSVVIHQSALNDLLKAVGNLNGEGPLLFNSKVATFEWKAEQLHVQITDSGAVFTANVFVRGVGMYYQSPAQGTGVVEYDLDKEQIDLVLSNVPFDFRFKILGKRIKIATLNIANLVGPRIGILGNLPLHANFSVKKHDGKKPLRLTILRHVIRYEPERVLIDFEVDFTENDDTITTDHPDSTVVNPSLEPSPEN